MSLLNKASLIQIPSGYKDGTLYSAKPTNGDGDFTFSRGSNLAATRVNSEGLIQKGRENLLLQSNTFNTTWNLENLSVTSGQSGYDGSSDAWKVTPSIDDTYHRLTNSVSGASNMVTTLSVYAKADGYNFLRVSENATTGDYATFNLSNGSVANNTSLDAKIESIGNGWYRCSSTIIPATTHRFDMYVMETATIQQPWDGDGVSGILIQDAQLEVGLISTDVITTTTTTAQAGILEDMPRLDYSGGASCPSLLLEPQRVNHLTQSEYYSGGTWIKQSGTTVTQNTTDTLSPEGKYNASKVTSNGSNGLFHTLVYSAGGANTKSIYLKGVSGGEVVYLKDPYQTVSTTTCTLTTEWQRFTLSETQTSSASLWIDDIPSGGIYMWGCQLESSASYVSSYIPTYGSSSTRSKDSCSKTGISSLIGQTEGTMFCEMGEDVNFGTVTTSIFCLDDNTANNRIELSITPTGNGRISFYISNGGTEQVNILSASTLSANDKIALTYKANDFVVYLNGTAIDTDTSGSVPTTNIARIAQRYDGGRTEKNSFKQAILFPTALTDAECIELTTI